MRIAGKVFKSGKYWAIEVPMLGVVTQGRTKREAYEMIADAIEMLIDRDDIQIDVYPGRGEYFEISSPNLPALVAFMLKRKRINQGFTLAEVARRMGSKSPNSYARYEQGKSVPTIDKLNSLLRAVSPQSDFVIIESKSDSHRNPLRCNTKVNE